MTDWREVKLGDVCDLIAGFAFKSKDFGDYPNKVIKITNIEPPFVNMTNLSGIDISKYDKNKLEKFIVQKGDYVLAMTGATIGKLGRVYSNCAYINQRVLLFKPKIKVDKDFLYYILVGYNFLQYVINHVDSESAQANISATTIGKYEFSLPPLDVQKKIAGVLGVLDDKIELNNKINNNLEQQAQALFLDIIRANDFDNKLLSEIALIKYGKGLPTNKLTKTGYKVFGGNGIIGYYTDYLYKEPQILISCRGAASGTILVSHPYSYVTNNSLVVELKDRRYFEFLKQYFALNQLHSYATGSAQPQVTIDNLKTVEVPYPDYKIISNASECFASISNKLYKNICENEKLAQLRDTLLPKLMSGEIDVSNVNISGLSSNDKLSFSEKEIKNDIKQFT